jgi:hypothetical protein
VLGDGELDALDLLGGESVALLVDAAEAVLLFGGQLVALVNQEAALAHALLADVLLIDLVDVHMQAHELCHALLPKQALSLKVALLDGLGGEDAGLVNGGPLPDAELHESEL